MAPLVEFDPRTRRLRVRRRRPPRRQQRGPLTQRFLQVCAAALSELRGGAIIGSRTVSRGGVTLVLPVRGGRPFTWREVVRLGAQKCCHPEIQALNPHGPYEGTECGTRKLIEPTLQLGSDALRRAFKEVGLTPRLVLPPPEAPALVAPPRRPRAPVTTPATPATVTTAAGVAAAADTRAVADRCTDRRFFQICETARRHIDQGFFPTGTRTETVLGESRLIETGRAPVTWEAIRRAGAARCCDTVIQAWNPAGPFAGTDCPKALVTPARFRPRPPAPTVAQRTKYFLKRFAPLTETQVQQQAPDPAALPAPPPAPRLFAWLNPQRTGYIGCPSPDTPCSPLYPIRFPEGDG